MAETIRNTPTNELDLSFMLTNSYWGQNEASQELKDKLSKIYALRDQDGKDFGTEKSSLWGLLSMYNRDMRLANLSDWNNELQSCRYMIDFASDCLTNDLPNSCIVSLSRSANIMETSQSKGGFLRKMMNTLIQKNIQDTGEAPKKGMFGGKKKGDY